MQITELVNILKDLRRKLLVSNDFIKYNDLLEYMLNPHEIMDLDKHGAIEAPYNIEGTKEFFSSIKNEIYYCYCNDRSNYRELITNGQCDIWDNVGRVYSRLFEIYERIEQAKIDLIDDSYHMACQEVRKILDLCSSCFSEVSKYEQIMGIDRYLSGINKSDTETIYDLIQKIKGVANKKLEKYKYYYQTQWNLSSISETIRHMLVQPNCDSPITKNVWVQQENVIMFIIDGLGYCQYLWNLKNSETNKSYTFNENIFAWMKGNAFFQDEYILGSSLISDTGAGLAQIYTGKLPKDTGIIASKVYRSDSEKFYHFRERYKSKLIDVKSTEFQFENLANPSCKSFVNDLKENEIDTSVYFCSRYHERSGFSKLCFGESEVHEILPPERVFRILFDGITERQKKQFDLVYYTTLDNTGHTTGAFSCFEYYEHKKVNALMTDFIIQLAQFKPWLFNGKTTIVVTADHGMAESSKGVIGRSAFYGLSPEFINSTDGIIECNRALLFYNVVSDKLPETAEKIRGIFCDNGISVKVYKKDDDIYKKLIFDPSNEFSVANSPDIVALIEGEGLIYNKNINHNLHHFSGHGGCGVEEVFVPLICINLTQELKNMIENRFLKMI